MFWILRACRSATGVQSSRRQYITVSVWLRSDGNEIRILVNFQASQRLYNSTTTFWTCLSGLTVPKLLSLVSDPKLRVPFPSRPGSGV